jgi:hypothetical protein
VSRRNRNLNRNPDDPEMEEEIEEETETESRLESSSSESGSREVELDRTFTYSGRQYGPGPTELPNKVADSIENKMKRLQEVEEQEKQDGLNALSGSTQTQVNNTVAPMEYFQEEEKLSRSAQKESKD